MQTLATSVFANEVPVFGMCTHANPPDRTHQKQKNLKPAAHSFSLKRKLIGSEALTHPHPIMPKKGNAAAAKKSKGKDDAGKKSVKVEATFAPAEEVGTYRASLLPF